jgi:hypothetical protein
MPSLREWWDRLVGRSSPPGEPPTAQTLEYENMDAAHRRDAASEALGERDQDRDEN